MLKITRLLSAFLCILLIFTVSCTSSCSKKSAMSVKLGMLGIEDNLPFFVAQYENIFQRNGVIVELLSFNSARERDIALISGEIHGELADILATALIKKGGTSVKIVSMGMGSKPQEGRFAVLSAPNSEITSPEDLKAITVAISEHTIIHYLAEEMIKESGLNPKDIKFRNIPDMSLRLEYLLAGKDVKAALLPDPMASLAEKMGARVIIDDAKLSMNLSQTVIIFREETLQEQAVHIKGILSSYQEGALLLNENPEKYRDLVIEKARIPPSLEYSYIIPKFSPLQLPTEDMISRVITWMTEKGLLENTYSYEDLVTPGYLGG